VNEARKLMIEAIAREMLSLPKAIPKLAIVGGYGVKKLAPERQETVVIRPLERRKLQASSRK
jgi:hypothetical protein